MEFLAQPGDLNVLLGETVATVKAELLLSLATGAVQTEARQQLVAVENDVLQLIGTTDSWLELPERPVTAVALVKVDGETVSEGTDASAYQKRGSRLWRECGWSDNPYRPAKVEVTCSHGYATGHHALGLAKATTLMLAAQAHANPQGATGFAIDDYREQYQQMVTTLAGQVPPSVAKALRRAYGPRGALTRLG